MKTKNLIPKKNTLQFLCLLLSCVSNLVFSKNDIQKYRQMHQEETKKFLYVEVYVKEGIDLEVRLNDIPVCEVSINNKEGYGNAFALATYHIIPGTNTLSVNPSSKTGKATIRLAQYTKGEFTGEDNGETLIKIEIENDDTPIHKTIELSKKKRWSWMDTDFINDQKSKEEAIAFSKSFYKIMEQSNIEEMIAAADPILNDELKIKSETTKEKLVEQWRQGLKMVLKDPYIFDDIDSIAIKLVPIANGKLFEVQREDGSSLFRSSDKNEHPIGFRSIIGRKNGIWNFYH
ncbi:hypothetical protein ACWGOQ_0022535 [Aquimarina sp. M1]